MKLFLYDDAAARAWHPFALTRPVGELLFGCSLLRERAESVWQERCSGVVSDDDLKGFEEPGAPPVVDLAALSSSDTRVMLNSRVSWDGGSVPETDRTAVIVVEGAVAGWILPPGTETPSEAELLEGTVSAEAERVTMGGTVLAEPWDLVAANARAIERQAESLGHYRLGALDGVQVIGDAEVYAGTDAVVEPGVILDVRGGPVVLGARAVVRGPARLTGPLYVGSDSIVFGGPVGTSSIGERCKVRGEVADSVFTGFCNKAHDGHIGHALLGRWVNLGAMTTNSDLKNTYGEVRVDRGRGPEATGLLKVGCFLGDHVRTGIGTLIGTGSVIGAGSNVFGGGAPLYVPPFTWAAGGASTDYRFEGFLKTARTVLARRDQQLSDGMAAVLERAWRRSAELRRSRDVTA